ncbi:hypothetical protein [Legionella bozemanae]|uniref:Uncharacterized protein n=1 Tax=Legionella bozemanae TaxID=447 RepID=A0A0W0RQM5_LEGBO|nr:hypothetical protein [Legionella bozemanae]KTC73378.1 hypothetical protein Lboz_2024 [Legionella bozemanae]STO35604.1 Uncharacterised protein [Legionella bozemanae]
MSITPPKENLVDKVSKVIKAGIDSAVPGGAIATELLFSFVKIPYQKRSEEWQEAITDALMKIESNGINLEELKNNEDFIDILLQAIPMGLKHHQEEKRNMLKNAIIHSAENNAPELSLQQTFLNCIDTFTIWHIKILMLFTNPSKWFQNVGQGLPGVGMVGSVRSTLESAFPELSSNKSFVDYIWTDLYNKGFLSSNKELLQVSMTSQGGIEKRSTQLGDQFIEFVSE